METIVNTLRTGFVNGQLKSYQHRIQILNKLYSVLKENEKAFYLSLKQDFQKEELETYLTELFVVYDEINFFRKHLKKLMAPRRIGTPLVILPAKSKIYYEPKGVVLIIGAWNYPVNLTLIPLVGAIASGNTVLLKPSEIAANTSALLENLINSNFQDDILKVVEGDASVTQKILEQKFDHVFYTGSERVGKIVYEAAAKHLSTVTLELGGKSPAIFGPSFKADTAIRRLLWGKMVNGGQTCVAPDYVLVPEASRALFTEKIKSTWTDFTSDQKFCRIINQRNYERLKGFLDGDYQVIAGGKTNDKDLFIEPTIIEINSLEHPIMREEIFGPILPVYFYQTEAELKAFYNNYPNPLALYIFSSDNNFTQKIIHNFPSGGVLVNHCLMHLANNKLPFGGRGTSGFGNYHGEHSMRCFSHEKAVMKQATWFDNKLYYKPYTSKNYKLLKRLTGLVS